MKHKLSNFILILVFFVGLSVMLYPTVSNAINERNQSIAVAAYDESVSQMSQTDYDAYFQAAEDYNRALAANPAAFYDPELLDNYDEILDVSGMGIMGYVTIDKINVNLPIYHGTSDVVMENGAGHLEGSSLPIGGESTHSVLTAHRGLPSAKLFTDLDRLEVGDTFTITVLNRVLTYEVDLISIVLPEEMDLLQITEGQDYCTLVTCTPYGINTHRILVRGHRIETESSDAANITAEAYQLDVISVAPLFAVPLLVLLLLYLLFHRRKKKQAENEEGQKQTDNGKKKRRKAENSRSLEKEAPESRKNSTKDS